MYTEERLKSKIIQEAMAKNGEAISEKRDGSGSRIKQGRKHAFSLPSVWRKPDLLSLQAKLWSDNGLIADWLLG
jgi:hypothetical protein